jgi:hypothetical protein
VTTDPVCGNCHFPVKSEVRAPQDPDFVFYLGDIKLAQKLFSGDGFQAFADTVRMTPLRAFAVRAAASRSSSFSHETIPATSGVRQVAARLVVSNIMALLLTVGTVGLFA